MVTALYKNKSRKKGNTLTTDYFTEKSCYSHKKITKTDLKTKQNGIRINVLFLYF